MLKRLAVEQQDLWTVDILRQTCLIHPAGGLAGRSAFHVGSWSGGADAPLWQLRSGFYRPQRRFKLELQSLGNLRFPEAAVRWVFKVVSGFNCVFVGFPQSERRGGRCVRRRPGCSPREKIFHPNSWTWSRLPPSGGHGRAKNCENTNRTLPQVAAAKFNVFNQDFDW